MKIPGFLSEIRKRTKAHILLLTVFHLVSFIGIKISIYYTTREFLHQDTVIDPGISPVSCHFLSRSEIEILYSLDETKNLRGEARSFHEKGCLCFALKHGDEYAAYMWCNLEYSNVDFCPLPLQTGEAYLFRARTMDSCKGKNLAPFLRNELYKELARMGYTKYYSVTERFNLPAVNFKKKLQAHNERLYFFLGIFNFRLMNLVLKKYSC